MPSKPDVLLISTIDFCYEVKGLWVFVFRGAFFQGNHMIAKSCGWTHSLWNTNYTGPGRTRAICFHSFAQDLKGNVCSELAALISCSGWLFQSAGTWNVVFFHDHLAMFALHSYSAHCPPWNVCRRQFESSVLSPIWSCLSINGVRCDLWQNDGDPAVIKCISVNRHMTYLLDNPECKIVLFFKCPTEIYFLSKFAWPVSVCLDQGWGQITGNRAHFNYIQMDALHIDRFTQLTWTKFELFHL